MADVNIEQMKHFQPILRSRELRWNILDVEGGGLGFLVLCLDWG